MTKCAVKWCKNYSRGSNNVSFHLFPGDPPQKRKWVKAVRRDEAWIPTKHSAICSVHFETACFNTNAKKQKKLKKDAVPTLFLPIYSHEINCDTKEYLNSKFQASSSITSSLIASKKEVNNKHSIENVQINQGVVQTESTNPLREESTSKQAAIIENPTPSNASTSNYTPSTTSDSALPTHEEQDLPGPSSYDEYQIFGEYVANELRNMNYLKYKGELKRKIQRLIIEYTEKDENEYLANTNSESPAATYSALEGPTSKAASTEEPSTSQDLYMDSKDDIVKIEILDPLIEDE